jgi:hypothetical protein
MTAATSVHCHWPLVGKESSSSPKQLTIMSLILTQAEDQVAKHRLYS